MINTEIKFEHFGNKNQYDSRENRIKFLVNEFSTILKNSVLDVGCDEKHLSKLIDTNIKYLGIDVSDEADLKINLDKEKLPFENNSFDTIVCLDVLEHLDEFHKVFDQLLNISNKHIIISLPNSWFEFKKILWKNYSDKFYGLPIEKPIDRHRWFFNQSEIEEFFIGKLKGKVNKITFFPYFNKSNKLIKGLFKLILSRQRFNNLFSPTIWIVIEK